MTYPAQIIAKQPGAVGSFDPLNQIGTIGVKVEIDGKQYGAWVELGPDEMQRIGLVITDTVRFQLKLEELTPP